MNKIVTFLFLVVLFASFTNKNSEFIVVATPTDYDSENNFFNTKSVENVIKDALQHNPKATIVIKSTIPVGFTKRLNNNLKYDFLQKYKILDFFCLGI